MKRIIALTMIAIFALAGWADDSAADTAGYRVYATMYHPEFGTHTASGDRIQSKKVKNGEHRWVALSLDMYRRYGFKMGDTIIVTSDKCDWVNGEWVVKDKMRGSRKIDFLVHRDHKHKFRNGYVRIRRK